MRDLFAGLFGYFVSIPGLFALATLDATVVFFFPLALDVAVVTLAASSPDRFWVYPLVASAGSITGASFTFWLGRRLGEAGLQQLVPARRLDAIKRRVRRGGAVAMASPAFLPPPFPFTPFILTSGALDVRQSSFLVTMGSMRLVRFGSEAILARRYGTQIVEWLESDLFRTTMAVLVVAALVGTVFSTYSLVRKTRGAGLGHQGR